MNDDIYEIMHQLEQYNGELLERHQMDEKKIERLEKQLKIAVEALSWYDGLEDILIGWEIGTGQKKGTAKQALKDLEELNK